MLEPLDIFKIQKTYVGKAAGTTFEVATSTIEQLASIAPGEGSEKTSETWHRQLRTLHQLCGRGTCVRFP